jgi:quinol monooxygenase YgiN
MQTTVAVFGILRFPPDKLPALRPHLKQLVDATSKLDGCVAYDVAEDLFEPGLLRFSELWPDRAALERHLKAPHIAPWRMAARECSLLERKFTAYDVAGAWEV